MTQEQANELNREQAMEVVLLFRGLIFLEENN